MWQQDCGRELQPPVPGWKGAQSGGGEGEREDLRSGGGRKGMVAMWKEGSCSNTKERMWY